MKHQLQAQEVAQRLHELRLGLQSREQVARWARAWQRSPAPIHNGLLLRIVVMLAAADLPGVTRIYLYGDADIEAWETELLCNLLGVSQAGAPQANGAVRFQASHDPRVK